MKRVKNKIFSKYLLKRIFILILSMVLIIIMTFISVIYYNVSTTVVDYKKQSNHELLSQMKGNIEYLHNMIVNVCYTLYLNTDVQTLMYGENLEMGELATRINRIRTTCVDSHKYIHSIDIYNYNTDEFYNTFIQMYRSDSEIEKIIKSGDAVPFNKPFLRDYQTPNGTVQVFSYFMHDTVDANNKMKGAVVINVSVDWLVNCIQSVGNHFYQNPGEIIVCNADGNLIMSQPTELKLNAAYDEVFAKISERSAGSGSFNYETRKEHYIVSYVKIDNADWVIFDIQSVSDFYSEMNKIRSFLIFITISFIALMMLASALVSKRIYKPIGSLVQQIEHSPMNNALFPASKNEITYLKEVYINTIDQLKQHENEKRKNESILKNFFLGRMLLDSGNVTMEEFQEVCTKYDFAVMQKQLYCVCVIDIDNYIDFENNYNNKDRQLYKFGINNIITELISESFQNDFIDVGEKYFIYLVNCGESPDFQRQIVAILKKAQSAICNYLSISITASVSDTCSDIARMTEMYKQAIEMVKYRFILGNMHIITSDLISVNIENYGSDIISSLDRKLIKDIKQGNDTGMQNTLSEIFEELTKMNYQSVKSYISHLSTMIETTVQEINSNSMEFIELDSDIFIKINDKTNLKEVYDDFSELLNRFISRQRNPVDSRHLLLVRSIKEIIDLNYHDEDLCLQTIADMVKMSPIYAGKVFYDVTKTTIPKYIDDMRMNRAVELLTTTDLNISTIANKIGMKNTNYFYTKFKKKFGVTPKEYMTKKALDNINQS